MVDPTEAFGLVINQTLVVSDEGFLVLFDSPTDAFNFAKRRLPQSVRSRIGVVPLNARRLEILAKQHEFAKCDYRGFSDGKQLMFEACVHDDGMKERRSRT